MINPIIFGHRGASALEPENTMRAFARAFQDGATGIEFDIRLTKDKQIVVIHDKSINRTSNGKGLVKDITYKELQEYDFGKGEKIPLLKDVLKLYGNRFWLNIEIKETGYEKEVVELLHKFEIKKKCLISSFNESALIEVKKFNDNLPTAFLYVEARIDFYKIISELKSNGIHPRKNHLTKRLIERAHKAGLSVRTWTVNKPKRAIKLTKMGIDGIITDNPKVIIEVLAEKLG